MPTTPVNAIISIGLSLLPLPAMKVLDQFNGGCGDGMCGFFSGLLILGALAVASAAFLVRSIRRAETPTALRLAPPVLWALALAPLLV